MDKHKRLFYLLPDGVRPDLSGVIASADKEAIIEHAAIVWLMGRATEQNTALSMTCHDLDGSKYQIMFGCLWAVDGDTLIDALIAAVEREVGNDE